MELQNVIDEFNKIIDSLQLDWGENGYKVNVLKGEKRASIYFFDTKIGELSYRGRGKNKHAVFAVEEKTILSKDDEGKNGEPSEFERLRQYLKNPNIDTISLGGPLTWLNKYLDTTTLAPHEIGGKKKITHYFPLSDDWSNLLTAFYRLTVSIPPDDIFGCCHLYEQCSDVGHCLQGIDYKRSCSYAKNLDTGRIFYGKNRNID